MGLVSSKLHRYRLLDPVQTAPDVPDAHYTHIITPAPSDIMSLRAPPPPPPSGGLDAPLTDQGAAGGGGGDPPQGRYSAAFQSRPQTLFNRVVTRHNS